MLTKTQVQVVIILLDNKGYAEWELAKYLEMEDSNLNPYFEKIGEHGDHISGRSQTIEKKQKRKGDYKEFPYYLTNKIDGIRIMIREIAHGNNFPDTGFVLQMIMKSKYLKSMREMVGKDLTKIIADELRGNYLPYVDPRFRSLKRFFQENRLSPPFLEDDMENQMGYHPIMGEPGKPLDIMHPEIEPWYHRYLGMRRSLRTKQL